MAAKSCSSYLVASGQNKDWGLGKASETDHETKGRAMIGFLTEACLNAGVDIVLSSPARKLLIGQAAVQGVLFDAGTVSSRVVIMACGGFSHKPELIKRLGDI